MRILVTGGGGYLGTVLVRRLLDLGHGVTVLDRFTWGTQPLAAVATPKLTALAGDIRDPRTVQSAQTMQDACIHLAGIVGYPACDADPDDADTTNVDGTKLLCHAFKTRPLVFASTGSTYGKLARGEVATEDTPISPLTRYGRNKAEAERLVLAVNGTVLRLATLFGLSPRMRWDLLPHDFLRRATRDGRLAVYDGHARRTFLHVEDAAWAFVTVLDEALTGTWNIGAFTLNHTKQEVAQHVQALTGCALSETAGHDPDERDYAVAYAKIQPYWMARRLFDLSDLLTFARIWREAR